MDDMTTLIILRMTERLLAVGIAGIAIYLGFRLFTLVPTLNDGTGELQLPGFGVVLSKAGPGVFFAAFGSAVLVWSLNSPVKFDGLEFSGGVAGVDQVINAEPVSGASTPQEGAKVAQAIQVLNCVEGLLVSPRIQMEAEDVEEAFRLAKEELLMSVWNDDWGPAATFRSWSLWGTGDINDEVERIYNTQLSACPS